MVHVVVWDVVLQETLSWQLLELVVTHHQSLVHVIRVILHQILPLNLRKGLLSLVGQLVQVQRVARRIWLIASSQVHVLVHLLLHDLGCSHDKLLLLVGGYVLHLILARSQINVSKVLVLEALYLIGIWLDSLVAGNATVSAHVVEVSHHVLLPIAGGSVLRIALNPTLSVLQNGTDALSANLVGSFHVYHLVFLLILVVTVLHQMLLQSCVDVATFWRPSNLRNAHIGSMLLY